MQRKFQENDKVVVTKRCPFYISDDIRKSRIRTIVSTFYNQKKQCTEYHLGSNKQGEDLTAYPFRSYQLRLATEKGLGRPRMKRRYERKI